MKKREKIMEYVFLLAAVISIVAVALICIFLFANGIPAMKKIGFAEFLTICRERTSATPAAARKGRRAIACPQDLHGLAQLLSDDRPFRRAGTPRTAPFGLDGRGVGPAGGVGAALFRRGQIRPLRPGGRIPALAAGRPAGSCGISHPAPAAPQPLPRGELPAPGRTQPQPLPL